MMSLKKPFAALFLIVISLSCVSSVAGQSETQQLPFFSLTILIPQDEFIEDISNHLLWNLYHIGISAEIKTVSDDIFRARVFGHQTHGDYQAGGFDIAFFDLENLFSPRDLYFYFHSKNIDPQSWAFNCYPLDNAFVDSILDQMRNGSANLEVSMETLMNYLIWDIHPISPFLEEDEIFFLQNNTLNFNTQTWDNIENIEFEEGYSVRQDRKLIWAGRGAPFDFNPIVGGNWRFDRLAVGPCFNYLVRREGIEGFTADLCEILPSPVDGTSLQTNQNYSKEEKMIWELRIPEGIRWHDGYGYTNVSVTTEDINWIYRVLIRSDVINPKRAHFQDVFGTNGNKAFEIINSTTLRFHLRYPYAEPLELFNVPILPRHILDPSFNSSPYGGPGVGFTADGSPILSYSDWSLSDFNRGTRGSNFTGPAVIGTGPFYFGSLDSETHEVHLLENSYYFKNRGQNCPTEYVYRPIAKVSNAIAALATGEVDILDTSYHLGDRTVYELLSNDSAYFSVQTPESSIHAFFYNLNNQYLKEKNVRLAISHIYGRDSPDYLLGDHGRQVSVPLPLDPPYYPSIPPLTFNVTRAREYMARAGYDTAILLTESELVPAFDPIMLFIVCLILISLKKRVGSSSYFFDQYRQL